MARSKDDIRSVVSGAGLITDVFTKLTKEVTKQGGSLEDMHRLSTDAGEETIVEIAKLIVQAPGQVVHVTVDYTDSLEGMIAAGRYDWKNNDINAKNFPIQGAGNIAVSTILVHFNRYISTADALAELDKLGLRPATLPELLAVGAKETKLQKQFPIIALGSVWQSPHGDRCVPCLGYDGSERELGLSRIGHGWIDVCRFLAVRK